MYFVLFAYSGFANILYGVTKVLVFVWTFAWLIFYRRLPWFGAMRNVKKSLLLGLSTGVGISLLSLGVYFFFRSFFDAFAPAMYEKVLQMKIKNYYLLFALVISIFHTLLEEFYWRFFVFKGLMLRMSVMGIAVISSIGFSLHHFVVLSQYFPWNLAIVFGAAVGIGGLMWCWIYAKTNSFLGSWLSHFFVDAGIFWLGYLMMFR